MRKIGISTVYTGYNYGSSLQAYAVKKIMEKLGYTGVVFRLGGSILPGRDVRMKKVFTIALRSVFHSRNLLSVFKLYRQPMMMEFPEGTDVKFQVFAKEYIQPSIMSWGQLKKAARNDAYAAFVCGSDQIWNADTYYVDPFYYLRFAPKRKRVAFAPSFGRTVVPQYNRKILARYISGIPHLSVRESSGKEIIKDLTGRTAQVLVDPTLVLTSEEWCELAGEACETEKYALVYFLNSPRAEYVAAIRNYAQERNLKIIGIPYAATVRELTEDIPAAGPMEFLSLLRNADIVFTDSFHGTAFSLNFGIPFYTFERNYGNAGKQSARLISLLNLTGTSHRYCTDATLNRQEIDFNNVAEVLSCERAKALTYLSESMQRIMKYEKQH